MIALDGAGVALYTTSVAGDGTAQPGAVQGATSADRNRPRVLVDSQGKQWAPLTAPRPRAKVARSIASQALQLALPPLLALPLLWYSLVSAPLLRIDVGAWGDHAYLSGVNDVEYSATEDYRWTTAQTQLTLPNLSERYRLLRIRAHGWRPAGISPPLVQVDVAGAPLTRIQTEATMRVYSVLLPRDGLRPQVRVGFDSPVYTPPGDARKVGFAIDWIELRALDGPTLPSPWQFGGQALLLALLALLLLALALPRRWATALSALMCGALIWANLSDPLWVSQALAAWLALAAGLIALTLLLEHRLRAALAPWMSARPARAAWALFIAALGLRLAGAVHPLFNSHDINVHMHWLDIVSGGQLYFYSTPGEFHNQQTFNPPGGYLLLLPLRLALPDARLTVQCGVALVDALGCALILPLARELRLSPRAGLLAMALYLALPINMTMQWWGFATNSLAQSAWLLLLWALLRLIRRPAARQLALFVAFGSVALLTHVGALVLTLALLVLCTLLGRRYIPRAGWRALAGGLLLIGLVVTSLYFSLVAGPLLAARHGIEPGGLGAALAAGWADRALRLDLVGRGLLLGFLPPTLALAALGLPRLYSAPERNPLQRVLLASWLAICLVFVAAYLGLGLVVRYIYFAAPLICLAAGALLAELWRRHGGRALALALALLIAWAGAAIWFEGVLMRIKPSLAPLTQ